MCENRTVKLSVRGYCAPIKKKLVWSPDEHTIKGGKPSVFSREHFTGRIMGLRTARGPFSAQPMLHTLFGNLNEQCKIPQKPSKSPLQLKRFQKLLVCYANVTFLICTTVPH